VAGDPPKIGVDRRIQPLRIPGGWDVGWNTLYVTSKAENGDFGGSTLFSAINEGRRFWIDVEFRPEFDPAGHFRLVVHYQPWPRTAKGRRRHDVPLAFGLDAESVHTFETKSYPELVDELEEWIARCSLWVRELN
jgi:hypothetical protein